ncbi:MAG: HAD hydrolase-like protein [Candidatus Nanoarchaeia archaeon]|nr:HAD hydrolase-like protein [Candidatus Nanoarchaeia archaeon]
MKLAFDLDGTLYDSLPFVFEADSETRIELGYPSISLEFYKKNFQMKDLKAFYRSLGIKEEHLEIVNDMFFKNFESKGPFYLVEGAKKALQKAVKNIGKENIIILTNRPSNTLDKLLGYNEIINLVNGIYRAPESKSDLIFELADSGFVYIGDLVSDGQACLDARNKGTKEIRFYGVLHEAAFNPRQDMISFIENHRDFAYPLESLNDIDVVLREIKSG